MVTLAKGIVLRGICYSRRIAGDARMASSSKASIIGLGSIFSPIRSPAGVFPCLI